jgi:heme-degrading monooxygenase HmoA
MYARVVTITGAEDIDGGVAFVRDTAVPLLRQQHGYRGLTASADRAGRVVGVLSLWETEADRDASDSALVKARQEGLGVMGGELRVENFEQVVVEIAAKPVPGSALMVTPVGMDPAKVDENLAFFTTEILPRITSLPGFRALRHMINRQTGEGMVGATWDDEASMRSAADAALARREEGIARGVSFGEVSFREIVLADLP